MRKLPLGNTNEHISSLCLGTMYFGTEINEKRAFLLLDQYAEAGGDFIDTANNYAFWLDGYEGGESERVIGRWLKRCKNRSNIFLATKLGFNTPPQKPPSLSPTAIRSEFDNSLRRLQTDYIDLLYAHIDDRDTPLEETLNAFNDLIIAGKVRHIGCSNTLTWRIERARQISQTNGWAQYCVFQQRHTYLRPKANVKAFADLQVPVNIELLDYLSSANNVLSCVAYSTLLGGAYAHENNQIPDNYQPEDYDRTNIDAQFATLRSIAEAHGATLSQVVLAWIVQNTPSMFAVISSSSQARLRENLDADKISLSQYQLEQLNQWW